MKKKICLCLLVVFAFFLASCSSGKTFGSRNDGDGIIDSDSTWDDSDHDDDTGDTVSDGDTGEPGPDGDTGYAGPDGDTGETVPDGDTGYTGPDGDTGDTEPDGDTGDTGPDGDTGDTEPDGDTGETVPDGDTCYTDLDDTYEIRLVAANLTSGNNQSYDPGHGIRLIKALRPDVVMIQEFNYKNNSSSDYSSITNQILSSDGYYSVDDSSFQIPNGIISRFPITSSGYWDDPNISNRELAWAVIDIPGEVDLLAVSVHLHTDPPSHQIEAAKIVAGKVKAMKASNPGKYYYAVGGDFNGDSAVSQNGFGKDGAFYVEGPYPADDNGNGYTNKKRNKPYDFVLVDENFNSCMVPVEFYSSRDASSVKSYEYGFVFDSRLYSQSELDEFFPPAEMNDSGSSNMQHMAVVKAFRIPVR